jgi:outer membrane protein assembly factor BamB
MPPAVILRSALLAIAAALVVGMPARAENWPQWRGPDGDGVSHETGLPLHWGDGKNILWTCVLPGQGASTPVVWGDVLFVTTQDGENLSLLKIDTKVGKIEWARQVGTGTPTRSGPRGRGGSSRSGQKFHNLHNMASPSPVTDGEMLVAHFGNGDLVAYDLAGRQLWHHNLQKDHGTYTIWWGHANSPVLYGDLVINVCMQDSLAKRGGQTVDSYLVAYDKRTGAQKWKTLRNTQATAEQCDAYTTPVLRRAGGRTELVVMGGNQVDAYDPATGKQLWFLPGIRGGRTITGPTLAHGLVYATQGQRGPLLAVRPAAGGELSADAVAWKRTESTPDSPCPVVWKGLIFWVSDNGIAQCCDARTGESKWTQRLGGDFKASPVAAADRVYFLNKNGVCTVLAAAPKFEKLATNRIEGETLASPAISNGRIYLRSRGTVYCIGVR